MFFLTSMSALRFQNCWISSMNFSKTAMHCTAEKTWSKYNEVIILRRNDANVTIKSKKHSSAVIIWININKLQHKLFYNFVLYILRLIKNPLSCNLQKMIFWANVKPMLFMLSGVAYFIWRRSVKKSCL